MAGTLHPTAPTASAPDAPYCDSASLWRVTNGFFILALACFAADFAFLFLLRSHEIPNILAWCAAIGAGCGWALSAKAREAAGRHGAGSPPRYLSAEAWSAFAVFTAFLAFYAETGWMAPSPYKAHVLEAATILRGHLYIDMFPEKGAIEHAIFHGHWYELHPPLPAILMLPLAAIWGTNVNQTVFSLIWGAFDMALAWWMLGRLEISTKSRCWLTIFFGAGTTLWWEALNGGSWDVTQTVAIGFTLAALAEVFGKARPWLVGLLAGLAALARYDLGPEFPIYAALVYLRRRNWRELIWLVPGFALSGVVFVGMNELRYHSWFDRSLALIAVGIIGNAPLFSTRYFTSNLNTLLFLAPSLNHKFPYLHPRSAGQAITFTSPAFILALRASLREMDTLLIWGGVLIAMLPSLFFVWNGMVQVGVRHYLHGYPFLLVLMALGMKRHTDQLAIILIVVSFALVAFTVWHVQIWGLTG
ncbi:MAG: hypothetical protein ACREQI_12050 [Candidatus Binataceae bacterium]